MRSHNKPVCSNRSYEPLRLSDERSAVDLKDNFEQDFVQGPQENTGAPRSESPTIMNEIKLIIGQQELKALYEETQREIRVGVITRENE